MHVLGSLVSRYCFDLFWLVLLIIGLEFLQVGLLKLARWRRSKVSKALIKG